MFWNNSFWGAGKRCTTLSEFCKPFHTMIIYFLCLRYEFETLWLLILANIWCCQVFSMPFHCTYSVFLFLVYILPGNLWRQIFLFSRDNLLFTCIHLLFILCIWMFLPNCMSMHHVCAWFWRRSEGGTKSLGIGDMDGCDPPCGCCELNLGHLWNNRYS